MHSESVFEQLDQAIEGLMANPGGIAVEDPGLAGLMAVAVELRFLPAEDFKQRLRAQLLEQAPWSTVQVAPRHEILPTLFGESYGAYPVERMNFAVSLLLHAAALALVVYSGTWIVANKGALKTNVIGLVGASPYVLPADATPAGGGGGGGDRDKFAASKGSLPRLSDQQLAPPAVVIRNTDPKLPVEATVMAPPALQLPQSAHLGDPMSAIFGPPSNGTGSGGGIGTGSGGGVGEGTGPGVGPGHGGGIGGGVYRVGGGVSAPRALYAPDPDYSDEARKAKYQGVVVLWLVVDANGRPRDVRVARSLGMGLDEKAIEAVRKWRFEAAKLDGRPVPVQINVEVSFRLY